MRHALILCALAVALFSFTAPAHADLGLPVFDRALAGAQGEALTQASFYPNAIGVAAPVDLGEEQSPSAMPFDPWRRLGFGGQQLAITEPRRGQRGNPQRPKAAAAAGGPR